MQYYSYALISIFLLLSTQVIAKDPIASKEFTASSVRMTISDLDEIINNIRNITNQSNSFEYISEEITLSHKGESIRLESWTSLSEQEYLPSVSTSLTYNFLTEGDASISQVYMNLSNYSRTVFIKGTDKNKMELLSLYLNNKLSQHSSFLTKDFVKQGGAILLITLGAAILFLLKNNAPNLYILSFGWVILVSPFLFPWSDWLPGTVVFSGSSSYIERHINIITLLGLLLALVPYIVTIYKSYFKHGRLG